MNLGELKDVIEAIIASDARNAQLPVHIHTENGYTDKFMFDVDSLKITLRVNDTADNLSGNFILGTIDPMYIRMHIPLVLVDEKEPTKWNFMFKPIDHKISPLYFDRVPITYLTANLRQKIYRREIIRIELS